MSESETATEKKLRQLIYRSENPKCRSEQRNRMRHKLLNLAIEVNEYDVWLKIANAFVRACNADDLTPQVSDRFVDHCPEKVFRVLGPEVSPYERFSGWRKRIDAALTR